MTNTPLSILSTLFPTLVESARYASLIQMRIEALEEKQGTNNIFAAALSDADLSIQTHIELSILANFPKIPFFGEEWKSSRNTKYLSNTWFVEDEPYLITLDPIDGTRIYLDGGNLYQIILTVVSRDSYEGVIVLYPSLNQYIYALRGKGLFKGSLNTPIEKAEAYRVVAPSNSIHISSEFANLIPQLKLKFNEVICTANYSKGANAPYPGSILLGGLSGMILDESQVIDGAALSFMAKEMGFLVQTLDGKSFPRIADYQNLVLPGLLIGSSKEVLSVLSESIESFYKMKTSCQQS